MTSNRNIKREAQAIKDQRVLKENEKSFYRLWASTDSPYSWKLRTYMNYKNIPYKRMRIDATAFMETIPQLVGMPVMPVMLAPDDQVMQDTTPIMEFFEQEYTDRSCSPSDPRLQFINVLLEDFADEYFGRFSMHYRWGNEQNRQTVSHRIARALLYGNEDMHPKQVAPMVLQRQEGFDASLGLNSDEIRQSIHQQLLDLLAILDRHFCDHQFLLGDRPSLADFAFYAPLYTHLLQDPYSAEIMECHGARTCNWIDTINEFGDSRGCLGQTEFGQWLNLDEGVPEAIKALLAFSSKTYVPFSTGVAKAIKENPRAKQASALIYGVWTEYGAFAYRAWSLEQVQIRYQALSGDSKAFVEQLLTETHVLPGLMEHGVVHVDLFDGFTPPFIKDGICDARVRNLKEKQRDTGPKWDKTPKV
jgi:glutathione S-transferase